MILKINSVKDLTIDWLKENHYDIYFFGLGFIQVKVDEQRRFHFYHSELPAFVENPHDHRYDFISQVLNGRLVNEVWEESLSGEKTEIEYALCQRGESDISTPKSYLGFTNYIGKFIVGAGSSYYICKNTFHKVEPDFDVGPCVTFLTRGKVQKDYAKVLKLPGYVETCPFSKEISDSQLWELIQDCLSK